MVVRAPCHRPGESERDPAEEWCWSGHECCFGLAESRQLSHIGHYQPTGEHLSRTGLLCDSGVELHGSPSAKQQICCACP